MQKSLIATAVAVLLSARVEAASVVLAGLADGEHGRSYDMDVAFSPTDHWTLGAGSGRSESSVPGAAFSGTSLRLSTDIQLGAVSAGTAVQRWRDSNQLRSTSVLGQVGWMADNGP
jgi:hypothetical protein